MSDRPRNITQGRRRRTASTFLLQLLVALVIVAAVGYVAGRYAGDALL